MKQNMKARVSQLIKTEAEWQQYASWKPEAGEFVVYAPDNKTSHARLKVGDGQRALKDLEFLIDAAAEALLASKQHMEIIDGGRISD